MAAEEELRRREVKWSALPEGLVVADKPEKLDDALVGLLLFMRWPTPHGWQVGKITSKITSATPCLFKSFNYRCSWSDGWSNQMLRLDEYGGGDEAEYNSWVMGHPRESRARARGGGQQLRHFPLSWRSMLLPVTPSGIPPVWAVTAG